MQQKAKLSHPLFSKINANSVTCQVEKVLSELPNECFCERCEPHATQLPAGSNTHYPCGIIPPSDRLRLSAHCFPSCSARVSLSSLCSPCMCKHLRVWNSPLWLRGMCHRCRWGCHYAPDVHTLVHYLALYFPGIRRVMWYRCAYQPLSRCSVVD